MSSLLMAIVATLLLQRVLRRLKDTTMVMPGLWTVATFWSLAALGVAPTNQATAFMLAAVSLCPGIAWMGARRPHDKAWQLIVASLWLVIVLPALRELALPSEGDFHLHILRQVFVWVLVGILTLAILPTRHWPSGVLVLAGQLALWSPFIPGLPMTTIPLAVTVASGFFLSALVTAVVLGREATVENWPATRAWLDFRDTFGGFWAIRLMDRVNTAVEQEGWEFQLKWSGFESLEAQTLDQAPASQVRELHQYLRNILRRFANRDWVDRRLGDDDGPFASTPVVN